MRGNVGAVKQINAAAKCLALAAPGVAAFQRKPGDSQSED
jgi:hypothetical protein